MKLVIQTSLETIQEWSETNRSPQPKEERFPAGHLRQLGNRVLSIGRFPEVTLQVSNTRSKYSVNDSSCPLGDVACRSQVRDSSEAARAHRTSGTIDPVRYQNQNAAVCMHWPAIHQVRRRKIGTAECASITQR